MAYITEQKVGKHVYLYECVSYRNAQGKPRNKKKPVGKVDPVTGERRYKLEYRERMRLSGTPVETASTEPVFSVEDIRKSSLLAYGAFHLLQGIAESSGLTEVLAEAFPDHWAELFMLAAHLVINGEPFMYCADWIESSESYPVGDLSSQRISEMLTVLQPEAREFFYQAWCERRMEAEYLALDVTSVSSYSALIEDAEWGYNRDGEDLPQVNLCLLVGEQSRLPIYQVLYAGSLNDVGTLRTTLRRFDRITGGKPVLLVMDKGFYSQQNVADMLAAEDAKKFIVAVPFTSGFAKKQVEHERQCIDSITKTLRIGGEKTLRAVTREHKLGSGHTLHAHLYFSPDKAYGRREDLFAHVALLRDEAEANPAKYVHSPEHRNYLDIRASADGYTVHIKEDAVDAALGLRGWLLLLSSDVSSAKEAIQIYRAKDVVEKGFLRLKCDLDLGRLRVHSQERMQNKVFVGFLSLILLSRIHAVMSENGMYARMTMKQLLRTMAKHRVQTINSERILYPATKTQREIYKAFGLSVPV